MHILVQIGGHLCVQNHEKWVCDKKTVYKRKLLCYNILITMGGERYETG